MSKDKVGAKHQERKTGSMCGKTEQNSKPQLEKGKSWSLISRANLGGEDAHKDVEGVRGAAASLVEFGNRVREKRMRAGQLEVAEGGRLLKFQATHLFGSCRVQF